MNAPHPPPFTHLGLFSPPICDVLESHVIGYVVVSPSMFNVMPAILTPRIHHTWDGVTAIADAARDYYPDAVILLAVATRDGSIVLGDVDDEGHAQIVGDKHRRPIIIRHPLT